MPNTIRAPSVTTWVDEHQVAKLIRCSLSKLRSDRQKCRGLPYTKFGRSVRYAVVDIELFMASHRIEPIN